MRFLAILLLVISACSVKRQTEDYNMQTVADLTLTPDNHPHGYTRSQCFMCHLPNNIHQVDRIGAPSFSLAKPLVDQYGLSICASCHGSNGVAP